MPLTLGARLGPYEILDPLGAGGMGEVYKARDTRLQRDVAIKVISSFVASAPELRERFEREARTISQLNHPNICALYDVGRHEGIDYLVLEYLEGESLAERLRRGPMPHDQALAIAIQVCEALVAAHRSGVVHRDLKPGNVFLVRGGSASAPPTAKLLDFGLAKTLTTAPASGGAVSAPPTVTTPITAQGTILGTFQYMAPEQVEGQDADARSDIWAFGCVLYEMISGRHAFEGKTQASLIGAIMHAQPAPLGTLHPVTPPLLDRVVQTCLAKDPADRFQATHDLLLQLRWIREGGSAAGLPAPVVSARRRRERLAWVAAGFGAAAAAAGVTWFLLRAPELPRQPTTRATIELPASAPLLSVISVNLAIAPDGGLIVYSGGSGDNVALYKRRIDGFEVERIAGTENASQPFFSPDGEWLGFWIGGALRKIPVSGGAVLTIGEAPSPTGATWGPGNTIVFSSGIEGLFKVSADGGRPELLVKPPEGQGYRWPSFVPGTDVLLFAASRGETWNDAEIVAMSVAAGERRVIVSGGSSPRYVPGGHVLFVREGAMLAVAFDPDRLESAGSPVPVGTSVAFSGTEGRAQFAVAANGTLVYQAGAQRQDRSLVWVSRDGSAEELGLPLNGYEQPRISPDGRRVALTIRGDQPDVWVLDLQRRGLSRLTFDSHEDESPAWMPGGQIAFAGSRAGQVRGTLAKPADGSGEEELLFTVRTHQHLGGWSPDGRTLLFEQIGQQGWDVFAWEADRQEVRPLVENRFTNWGATLSPDGRWLAYSSNESGRFEVFVRPLEGRGRWQVSADGGEYPVWARSGRELFYSTGTKMMAVPVQIGDRFEAGLPRMLFEREQIPIGWGAANYDVSPDGKRFLMVHGNRQEHASPLQLVLNLPAELK
jgi:eukaryotic-like serine/threonine-protein kinase